MYVFGYGSLVNVESASRTLRRSLTVEELIPAYLLGYKRSWGVIDRVRSHKLEREISGVFLSIQPDQYARTLGAIIKVNDDEMSRLLLRERSYDCHEIGALITPFEESLPNLDKILTFVARENRRAIPGDPDSFVLAKYQSIVDNGCIALGADFTRSFRDTTQSPAFPILEGDYDFV